VEHSATACNRKATATLPAVLRKLDRHGEGVPLAAFGQTPLWDEPMKTIVAAGAGRSLVVGIHDLDYFSRLRVLLPGGRWQIVSRSDGVLRDAWIAAGELSALFGAEVWPTRQALANAGVRLDRVLATWRPERRREALERLTAAWGWRGIVQNVAAPSAVCDVLAREIAPVLIELLQWGFEQTARTLKQTAARRGVRAYGKGLVTVVRKFVTDHPQAVLSDLFEHLLRRMYEQLLGAVPDNVSFQGTRRFFTFNRRTASLPRFAFVEYFLHPRHGETARAAYDRAIAETAMIPLRAFGPAALPFDIHIPGRGRGTLHVTPHELSIALPKPVQIPLSQPVHTVARLAAACEDAFGPEIALVGKSVVLAPMICGEFVMVVNDSASAYIPRTRHMLNLMREAGIPLSLHPLLRIHLDTWGSLRACDAEFHLPEHLAQAFGKETVTGVEFARGWQRAVRNQSRLCRKLSRILSPCELVRYLGDEEHEDWFVKLNQCMKANEFLLEVQRRVDDLRRRILALRAREDEVQVAIKALEARRGKLNRGRLRPLKRKLNGACGNLSPSALKRLRAEHARAEREGKALLAALAIKQKERRQLRAQRRQIGRELRATERGPEANAARRTLHTVHRAGEKARLRLTRNAILASEGLERANLRPAAWWMPAVDPSGRWFERIRESARFRLEPLVGGEAR